MNVMYYINKYENAGRNFALEMGVASLMSKEVGFVAMEQTIRYFREVFEDDLLYVESSLIKLSNKAMTFRHEMYNGLTKEKVSEMDVVGVLFDKINRKSMELPEEARSKMLQLIMKN